jgi:hypothetical protein
MIANTQDAGKVIYAGLYRRVKKQICALNWGRGKRELIDRTEAETERPWAGVAEWLRVAHSLLDEKAVELTRNPDQSNRLSAIE